MLKYLMGCDVVEKGVPSRICIMAPAAAKGTGTAKARSAADGSGERRIQERVGGRCAQRHTASIKRQGSEISEMLLEIVK